ncbi:leucine-rich_repeat domain-containing protein [Hexamita inflata]|uniref:Leucine-rich repeat domain-containing protein n=1 Tax=Hexamita inflata TaxID=28002 RepID=A0AA86PI48_9EUKA|nr:leucine-rich repeat domain-containing protein [Hexamita inflata]
MQDNADQKQQRCQVTEQTQFTNDDVRNSSHLEGENITLTHVDKQLDNMPQHQYLTKMIQKYENMIQLKTRITIFNVSENELNQIGEIRILTRNERETFARNHRIECDQNESEKVLNKIKNINATFKVEVEEFRQLLMKYDNEPDNLSFVNEFNIQKLVVWSCKNVKLHGVANVKVLHVHGYFISIVDGIQNWNQLLELDLSGNYLESIAQLENLTQLKVLMLQQNNIQNLEPLRGLVNLTYLYLHINKIQNVEPLRSLVNLMDLRLEINNIKDFSPIQNHLNFKNYRTGGQQ